MNSKRIEASIAITLTAPRVTTSLDFVGNSTTITVEHGVTLLLAGTVEDDVTVHLQPGAKLVIGRRALIGRRFQAHGIQESIVCSNPEIIPADAHITPGVMST